MNLMMNPTTISTANSEPNPPLELDLRALMRATLRSYSDKNASLHARRRWRKTARTAKNTATTAAGAIRHQTDITDGHQRYVNSTLLVLADFGQAQLRLDRMAKRVPLEAPWTSSCSPPGRPTNHRTPLNLSGCCFDRLNPVQYLSLAYTDRLAELGIAPSVGSRGDSYDNALAEAVNAAYKTELIHRGKPWRCIDDVELSTAEWVAWYNQERLHEALGYVPPAEYEAALTGTSHPASQPTPALATD
jgi:transposase InsO family protein